MQDDGYILITMTAGSEAEGEKIARKLTEDHLVACVHIIPRIRSLYWWDGNLCDDEEVLLMAKSKRHLFAEICQLVKELHSYQVPEIIALSITDGLPNYLQWLSQSVEK